MQPGDLRGVCVCVHVRVCVCVCACVESWLGHQCSSSECCSSFHDSSRKLPLHPPATLPACIWWHGCPPLSSLPHPLQTLSALNPLHLSPAKQALRIRSGKLASPELLMAENKASCGAPPSPSRHPRLSPCL